MTVVTHMACADEVVLDNGDRITGKLVRLKEGKLIFKTDYACEITIQAKKVSRLATDEPVETTLLDGRIRKASIFSRYVPVGDIHSEVEKSPKDIDFAQVKDIYTKPKTAVRIKSRLNVGIMNEKGNTGTEQYHLNAELFARTEKIRFTIGGEINRERADDTTTVADWKGYGLYEYFVKPKWFLYASSLFEHEEFADLDLRTTLGAGGGHQFFESDELNLSVSASLAYVHENFIVAENEEFPGAQWIIQYDQFFFNKFVQLFHSNKGYISLDDASSWLINTRQGLRFPLYKGLVTTFQYNYDYNNNPSPDAESKWDSKFLFLLGYQFNN
jgi:hypothetical protein